MNLQTLVVVVLRLIALNFLLRIVIEMTPQMLHFAGVYDAFPRDGSRLFVAAWLVLGGLIVAAVLLWRFALPIARFVTRGVSPDLSFGAMSLVDCYSIAFMSVGLFYCASHFPQVLNWTHYFFKAAASSTGNSGEEGVQGYNVSHAFIPFIVGVVLFVNGRKWAVALARRQTQGPTTNYSSE